MGNGVGRMGVLGEGWSGSGGGGWESKDVHRVSTECPHMSTMGDVNKL